jgi:hypothetical protein
MKFSNNEYTQVGERKFKINHAAQEQPLLKYHMHTLHNWCDGQNPRFNHRHEVGAQFPVPYSLFLPNYVHT